MLSWTCEFWDFIINNCTKYLDSIFCWQSNLWSS